MTGQKSYLTWSALLSSERNIRKWDIFFANRTNISIFLLYLLVRWSSVFGRCCYWHLRINIALRNRKERSRFSLLFCILLRFLGIAMLSLLAYKIIQFQNINIHGCNWKFSASSCICNEAYHLITYNFYFFYSRENLGTALIENNILWFHFRGAKSGHDCRP